MDLKLEEKILESWPIEPRTASEARRVMMKLKHSLWASAKNPESTETVYRLIYNDDIVRDSEDGYLGTYFAIARGIGHLSLSDKTIASHMVHLIGRSVSTCEYRKRYWADMFVHLGAKAVEDLLLASDAPDLGDACTALYIWYRHKCTITDFIGTAIPERFMSRDIPLDLAINVVTHLRVWNAMDAIKFIARYEKFTLEHLKTISASVRTFVYNEYMRWLVADELNFAVKYGMDVADFTALYLSHPDNDWGSGNANVIQKHQLQIHDLIMERTKIGKHRAEIVCSFAFAWHGTSSAPN